MSRYLPLIIAALDLPIALDPEIGGEQKVYASYDPWLMAGSLMQPAEDSGVLTMDPSFAALTEGRDFQVMVDRTGARSSEVISITLDVVFADDSTGTALAEFEIPDRSGNQNYSIGQGTGTDLIGVGAGAEKKIKNITGINAVAGGAANNRFLIAALPEADSFFLIGCTEEADITLPLGASLPIPCGLNASAFVKRGRGEPGELTVTEKYVDYQAGLGRINGHFCSVKVEATKDERVLTERFVFGKWKAMGSPKKGDGDDVVKMQAKGNFETFAVFTAK